MMINGAQKSTYLDTSISFYDLCRLTIPLEKRKEKKHLLVGGWATPLKNMSSSIGMIRNLINMGK